MSFKSHQLRIQILLLILIWPTISFATITPKEQLREVWLTDDFSSSNWDTDKVVTLFADNGFPITSAQAQELIALEQQRRYDDALTYLYDAFNFEGDFQVKTATTVITTTTVRVEVKKIAGAINKRITKVVKSKQTRHSSPVRVVLFSDWQAGLASGEDYLENANYAERFAEYDQDLNGLAFWTTGSLTQSQHHQTEVASKSDLDNIIIGFDTGVGNDWTFGVSLAWEDIDVNTTFNEGHMNSEGLTVSPYLAYILNERFYLSANIGYGIGEISQDRQFNITTVKSDTDYARYIGNVNLNYQNTIEDRWNVLGYFGVLYAYDRQRDFVETDGTIIDTNVTRMGQFMLGTEVSYVYKQWEPFVNIEFEWEPHITSVSGVNNDTKGANGGIGVRYYLKDEPLFAEIMLNVVGLRQKYEESTISANLRVQF